jgi:Flp pilus assembly protein TadG
VILKTLTKAIEMKLRVSEKGASTVEFAMILPFLLVILFGIMEFGMLLFDKAIITNASREAARSAIAYKSSKLTTQQIQAIASNYTSNYLISSQSGTLSTITVTPSPTPTSSGTPITVTVTYPYTFFVFGNLYNLYISGAMSNQINLSATSVMINE